MRATSTSTRVSPVLLGRRLDPGYYRSADLAVESRIRQGKNAVVLLGDAISFFETGDGAKNSGPCRLLKTRAIVHDALDYSDYIETVSVPQELVLLDGDTLLTTYGVAMGKVAAVVGPPVNTTVDYTIAIIRADPRTADSFFLCSFLRTDAGQALIQRRAKGTSMPFVLRTDLEDMPIPNVELLAQRYIGNKVRQAELLRERARNARIQVQAQLDAVVPSYDASVRSISRVERRGVTDRLDCQPYRAHFRGLVEAIHQIQHDCLGEIAHLGSGDPVPSSEFTPVGVPLVRNRDIGRTGFGSIETAVSNAYAMRHLRYAAKEGLIVIGMDGEFRAQFVLNFDLPLHINQRVAMVLPYGIRAELLTAWLNRVEGQHQLNQWAVKTTVEHTSLEYISSVLVPRLPDLVETALADLLAVARCADWLAQALTIASKVLVESLIAGKIPESALVSAQIALESNDRTADRAILASVRRTTAPDAPALFPDLDALYALLDEDTSSGEN